MVRFAASRQPDGVYDRDRCWNSRSGPCNIEAWHIANDGHPIFNALDAGPRGWLRFQRKTIPMRQATPGE